MKRSFRSGRLAIFCLIALCVIFSALPARAATYRQGSRGGEVRTIQTKLKRWGYYTGSVDGVYGTKTVEAVKHFQRQNGLPADGICGQKTLAALGMSTSGGSTSSTTASRDDDFALLCRMISAEARGEPYTGQVAVGAVILNRVKHPSFPNTVAGVLFQPGAFSPVADGQFYKVTITDSARKAAQDALNGWDPTGGAIYFYNPAKSTSQWIFSRPVVLTIGEHVFAK
jgi:N-acetylmuramoyl-L-alanine amidase